MKKIILSMVLACAIFSSCRKEGPQGPQGPQGNANVTSESFTVTPSQWQVFCATGKTDTIKFVDFSIAAITQNIIDNGAVLVYSRHTNDLIPLPFSYQSLTTQVYYTDDIFPSDGTNAGGVEVQVQLGNYNIPTITTDETFKIVVVNGNYRLAHPEVNWKNANAVADFLHLDF